MSKTQAQRSLANRLWYRCLHFACRMTAVTLYRVRISGRENIPTNCGALVLSNHQSHLDPILVGLACNRRLNYVARQTLFHFAPFRWLIRSLDAIPLDREGLGLSGIKETLKRLRRGEMVLLFPEGTRTPHGEIQTLKPGFCALARRAGVPLLPVSIEGAYHAWPKQHTYPGVAVIEVCFGPPILTEEIATLEDRQLIDEVERRLRVCHAIARARRLKRIGDDI